MRRSPPAPPARYVAVLSLIALLPFVSGLIMLDPDRAIILGLATLSIMVLPIAMLLVWPEVWRGLWPGGRIATLTALVMGVAVLLAFTRAPHAGFSLMTLQFWLGALIAGRAIQLAIQTHGPGVAHLAMLAMLVAGPLYVLLLPTMHLIYDATRYIDWDSDMPGFNHVRKMGHLLTASAAVAVGLVATGALSHGSRLFRGAVGVLTVIALALALWMSARGAWMALGAGAGICTLTAWRAGWATNWRAIAVLLIPAFALALAIPAPGQHLGMLERVSSSIASSDSLNALSTGRIFIWTQAVELIADAPITGYGWGQYIFLQPVRPMPQVHNLPLDLLLGLGVPIGLLALGLIAVLWVAAHRRAVAAGAWTLPALCVLNTMAIYSLVSGTYYYGVPVVLTGLAWGICLSGRPRDPAAPR